MGKSRALFVQLKLLTEEDDVFIPKASAAASLASLNIDTLRCKDDLDNKEGMHCVVIFPGALSSVRLDCISDMDCQGRTITKTHTLCNVIGIDRFGALGSMRLRHFNRSYVSEFLDIVGLI